jgi:hypothetical protein
MKKRRGTVTALLIAAALIGAGLAQGQERAVLMKAIYVCLECIGIG